MTTEAPATPTTRELQLELQVWMERAKTINANNQLLQTQTQLLQAQADECNANLARLRELLKPKATGDEASAKAAA